MVEQVQFTNNTATHGAAIDLNSTVPIPVIITQSLFDANQANILTAAQIADNMTLSHAGDGGGLRCLGGKKQFYQMLHQALHGECRQLGHPNCLSQETSISWRTYLKATLLQMARLSMLSKAVGRYHAVKLWAPCPGQ